MVKLGCSINGGHLDDSNFNQPIPWIGLYAAAASAVCALAMALDTFHGLRDRKFWIPCKFFSLNATTITLLTVATKLLVDLNTSMPRQQDQLAKLSASVFVCTAMGNFFPSLASTEHKDLLVNMLALAIFIITILANICIQLVTGVIYMFYKEHAVVMFLMLLLFAILVLSALTIPTTKRYFDRKYSKKYELAMRQCSYTWTTCKKKKLRDDMTRFWMMAHTCSPQFVMGRLATCTAAGAVCMLAQLVLAEAMFLSYIIKPGSLKFCHGTSVYKWSSTLVLVTQTVAIVVGSIAPASRWLSVISLIIAMCPKTASEAWRKQLDFKVEKYWTRQLKRWREHPLGLRVHGRLCRKLAHNIKNRSLCLCIWMQIGIVPLSKLMRLASIYLVTWSMMILVQLIRKLMIKFKIINDANSAVHEADDDQSQPSNIGLRIPDPDLKNYVLHLEGEEDLIDVMVKRNFDATGQWIRMGRKKQPKHLLELIKKMDPSRPFEGVWTFDIINRGDHQQLVPSSSLYEELGEPPNCWALPVVTLTSIAIAVCSSNSHDSSNSHLVNKQVLISGMKEGLSLIRIVEENLDKDAGGLTKMIRKAADMAWLGVDLNYKWLDVDLRNTGGRKNSSEQVQVVKELAAIAKRKVIAFLNSGEHEAGGDLRDNESTPPSRWPLNILVANSMYRICTTLLNHHLETTNETMRSTRGFIDRLSAMITDITAACLTNLRRVISMQCERSAFDEREESVRSAIVLLGRTEELLRLLDAHPIPTLDTNQLANIDDWRKISFCSAD